MNSLYFKIKDNVDVDKRRLLEILFQDWVDDTCDNQVKYMPESKETFRVDCEKPEDMMVLKLKGVPKEFQKFLEIVY